MANETRHIIKLWKGSYADYIKITPKDEWTRYVVSMPGATADDSIVEYYGDKRIQPYLAGTLYPVKDVCGVSSLPENLSVGERYLVGPDAAFEGGKLKPNVKTDGDWYVVIIYGTENETERRFEPEIKKLGKFSVRVESMGMKEYFLSDGVLITYDDIDGGTY